AGRRSGWQRSSGRGDARRRRGALPPGSRASAAARSAWALDKKSCQGYHLPMLDIQVIDDPAAATVALEPMRSRLLSELAMPASAATLASRVGLARQKVNYHLHARSEEHTSELQSRRDLVCRLLLEKKKKKRIINIWNT